ncbi:hypothetical protein Tco_1373867, partial [Tanacetum coccineum]
VIEQVAVRSGMDSKMAELRQLDIANKEAVYNFAEWGLGLDEVEE